MPKRSNTRRQPQRSRTAQQSISFVMQGDIENRVIPIREDLTRSVASQSVPSSIPRNILTQIHWFKRNISTQFTGSTSNDSFLKLTFKLSSLPGSTEITNLYQQYCIVGVDVKIQPLYNEVVTSSGSAPGNLLSAIDYTEASAATSQATLREYSSVVSTNSSIGHDRFLFPRVLVGTFNSTNYSAPGLTRMWLSTDDNDTAHFGLQVCLTQSNVITQLVTLEQTVYLAARNVN